MLFIETPFKTTSATLNAFYNEEHVFKDHNGETVRPGRREIGTQITFVGKKIRFLHRITRTYKLQMSH